MNNISDPYLISDPDDFNAQVLKNKLGIKNAEKLAEKEDEFVKLAIARLQKMPVLHISWDTDFYKDLHKFLFGDVYDWAGEFRTVDVGIANDHVAYESMNTGAEKLKRVFNYFTREVNGKRVIRNPREDQKREALAQIFGQLKTIQPFRDGNTRTAMVLTSILASNWGIALDWSAVAPPKETDNDFLKNEAEKNYLEFCNAQVKYRDGSPDALIKIFAFDLPCPLEDAKELKFPRALPYNGKSISEQIDQKEKTVQNFKTLYR